MNTKREYSLDVIKVIATVFIVFHHYQQVTGATFEGMINFNGGLFYFGYIVELFFVLSGYFMYGYIAKIEQGLVFPKFYFHRFIRLFPLLAAGAVVYEIFLSIYRNVFHGSWFDIDVTLWGTIITSLGIQEGWSLPNPCVNNPTWYISVLLLCYVIFYLSVYLSKRKNIPLLYIHMFLIFLGMGIQTYDINLPFLNHQAARGYYAFFFGVILAEVIKNRKIDGKMGIISLLIVLVIPILIYKQNAIMSNGLNYIMTFLYYPSLIILFRTPLIQKIFNRKWIGTLGAISFDVYIWHNPLFILMYIMLEALHLSVNLDSVKAMVVYTVICFIVGTVSYFGFEIPIHKWIKRKVAEH